MSATLAPQRWFGEFSIAPGQRGHWCIGPLELLVEHTTGEWRVRRSYANGLSANASFFRIEQAESAEEGAGDRYIVADRGSQFSLLPLLPDRAVVARPLSPVFVPAGETVRLYVSMPVWLRLAVGASHKILTELPTQTLSDTWFGLNTREGELCYALRSRCRLTLDGDVVRPDRAITPVRIRNRAGSVLGLERVRVPASQLSLYAEPDGRLWTSEVALERTEDGQFASLSIGSGAPSEARNARPLAGSRETPPKKNAIRAFSALFQ